jgi:hypothetical protein
MFLLGLAFYFIPTFIALSRRHPKEASIIVLNIFLGWTLIGWIVALIWSFSVPHQRASFGGAQLARNENISTSMSMPTWFLILFGSVVVACAWYVADDIRGTGNTTTSSVLSAAASEPKDAVSGSGWKLVTTAGGMGAKFGRYRYFRFVLVNPRVSEKRDRKTFDQAIANLCHPDEYCSLGFWSDLRFVPTVMPMTEAQLNHEKASYWNNPSTGENEFLWKCRKGDDPHTCFP